MVVNQITSTFMSIYRIDCAAAASFSQIDYTVSIIFFINLLNRYSLISFLHRSELTIHARKQSIVKDFPYTRNDITV